LCINTSCEDYLDKAPETDISDKDAFGNFFSFQGAVEVLHNLVQDHDKGGAWNNYSFADENINTYTYEFDLGNYWDDSRYFGSGSGANPTLTEARRRRIWGHAWYGIRHANLLLDKLNQEGLFEGTTEERNHLKGQVLFWRGWFYFEIGRYWGGMPYIDRLLSPGEILTTEEFNRLTFQETVKKMAADFRAAADLLPNHWDLSGPGQATLGNNMDRVNKFFALGYLGKALLFGASPMPNQEATGSNSFNEEMCRQAAEAFGELLTLAEQTGIYELQPWESYMDMFYRFNHQKTGGVEVIMRPTQYNRTRVRNSTVGATVPGSFGLNSGNSADVPTHNIVKNFVMADTGLPIYDPESGYDINDPWSKLEPRFVKYIVKDGDIIWSTPGPDREAQLYLGGRHRTQLNPASRTGYYQRKFNGMGPNFSASAAGNLSAYVPYLRLSDIYLMYAEAVNFSPNGSPNAKSSNYSLTAAQAVNKVRNRALVPDLHVKYTANREVFFEEVVRERAVEFFMEGARFCDLRRWNRNHDPRYLDKTAIDFERGPDGKPINVRERVLITRVAEAKHNWLPIPSGETRIFSGFPQNPGW
jgi:hypothetical protein